MSEDWSGLSKEEQRKKLLEQEKHLLETFVERKAISQEEYEKSMESITSDRKIAKLE